MKTSDYRELCKLLCNSDAEEADEETYQTRIQAARDQFPYLNMDTILAIVSQERSRRLRREYHRLTSPTAIKGYMQSYREGCDILQISKQNRIPPCILLRTLLQALLGLNKSQISLALKEPLSLFEIPFSFTNSASVCLSKVVQDAQRCIQSDGIASPRVEMVRRVAGLEYEHMLRGRLQKLEIPFLAEEALRVAGFSKTPDVKLEVPIGVCGRIVNWIDSKASFGDHYTHKIQGVPQFQRYINRYGPGLVIYWFGFIEEFDDHPDVLLLDHFPDDDEIYRLPRLDVQPRP